MHNSMGLPMHGLRWRLPTMHGPIFHAKREDPISPSADFRPGVKWVVCIEMDF